MIPKEITSNRRMLYAKDLDNSLTIFISALKKLYSNDKYYTYRQDTDFYYYTGIEEDRVIAILEKLDNKLTYYLFVPPYDPLYAVWDGSTITKEDAKSVYGADKVYFTNEFTNVLNDLILKYETIFIQDGINPKLDEIIKESIYKARNSKNKIGFGPVNIKSPYPNFHYQRVIKTEYELEFVKKSIDITVLGLKQAINSTKAGYTESQMEALIEYIYRRNGGRLASDGSIVGSGINGTILHYRKNNGVLKDGDLILIDTGCEYKYYTSDVTRTWPINGRFTKSQKDVYEIVLDVHKTCINMIKPGIKYWDVHMKAIEKLSEGMLKLGLFKENLDEILSSQLHRKYFMHGIGHWLGIDTHDCNYVPRTTEILKPGHLLTIEPGLYIGDRPEVPEEYKGIGVRIEDDILVTENGNLNLSGNKLPVEIDEIEKMVGKTELL